MLIARSVRGMNDLFAFELASWRPMEKALADIFLAFGYQEIRTPMLEEMALFKRSVGEDTDIVEKEMFIVKDGEHTYCLRPENTAGVVRALIERGGISEDMQEKLYYIGPMFRKERPQKGRLRQFHQFGIELFGVREASADVEVMAMVNHLFRSLELSGIRLKINTLGDYGERAAYKRVLSKFLSNQIGRLCEDCKRRMVTNPLRALDCKNKNCSEVASNAPRPIDALGEESRMHFDNVCLGLSDLSIDHEIDHRLVRGLDYYNQTVFEFVADIGLGAQNAVAAGGRYDGLFKTLGSKIDVPAIGCAGGLERIALLLKDSAVDAKALIEIALLGADEPGQQAIRGLAYELRRRGIAVDLSLSRKSLKAQMRRADKLGAKRIAVIGEKEIDLRRMVIKDMKSGETALVELDAAIIADRLQKGA